MVVNQVDAYIEKQKSPQKEILQELRMIFKETLPDCEEERRWGVVTFAAGKFYIAAMKNRLFEKYAECLFEKRGHRWAFTDFGFEVWGKTREEIDASGQAA